MDTSDDAKMYMDLKYRHCYMKAGSSKKTKEHSLELNLAKKDLKTAPYDKSYRSETNIHMGQRKLLLSEMQVFNEYYLSIAKSKSKKKRVSPIVVYVGSCPGHHIHAIHALYPDLIMYLYDGADASRWNQKLISEPYPNWKVRTGQDGFFTTEVCTKLKSELDALKPKHPILFVCDIRLDGKGFEGFENNVTRDMTLQKEWTKILMPEFTMLKFRLPYTLSTPTSDGKLPQWPYLKGVLYFGIWAPEMSGETRLMVRKKDIGDNKFYIKAGSPAPVPGKIPMIADEKEVLYDYTKYEQSNVYHNTFDRPFCFSEFKDFVKLDDTGFIHDQYCPCYDCIAELKVIKQYVDSVAKHTGTREDVLSVQSVVKCINETMSGTLIQQVPKYKVKPVKQFVSV